MSSTNRIDDLRKHFFHILREYKDDPSGRTLYTDPDRMNMHMSSLPFLEDLPTNFHSLLDSGCGPGFDCKWFAERGKKVLGITANCTPAQQEFARNHNFEIQNMDMNALELGDKSFDAVLCKHSLEHSFSPLLSLHEIRRVLKPNGYLFLVVPPHHQDLTESGHFTQGWTIGQVIYLLAVTGYNTKTGAFRIRHGNIEAVVQKSESLPEGRGLYEIKELLPDPIQKIMKDERHGAFPNNYYEQIAWPFDEKRKTIIRDRCAVYDKIPLRDFLRYRLRKKGDHGKNIIKAYLSKWRI